MQVVRQNDPIANSNHHKKTTQFRSLLTSDELAFICEAHNGLSAKIVEEAGFQAIWGSGLSLSAQYGVRDNNEASWTQILDMLEFMSDATSVPIMLDGDTGYGNFNNMQRLIKKLEQRNIAAVCIEDKLFPKTNSFIKGDSQPLADIEEFCGKIKAGKDAQSCDDFSIVARVEAFIAGWGLKEALKRAEAYHEAGADGILMHSALSNPDEIFAFTQEWANRCPVVIVPTKYYTTPTQSFRDQKISMVIWANHILRASITAMQKAANTLHEQENLIEVDNSIVMVKEIFRLQGAESLQEAEKEYLPKPKNTVQGLVLAASRGADLGSLTEDKPKTMVSVRGRPILQHISDSFIDAGIQKVSVVRGYKKDAVNVTGLHYIDNDKFADSGEIISIASSLDHLEKKDFETLVITYGDILFRKHLLNLLLEAEDGIAITVDTNWQESSNKETVADYVVCSMPYSRKNYRDPVMLSKITSNRNEDLHGEWTGLVKFSKDQFTAFSNLVRDLIKDPANHNLVLPDILNLMIEKGADVGVVYVTGNWLDIDTVEDLEIAGGFK